MFNKILSFYTKYFAVWVILFGAAAFFFPKIFLEASAYRKWFFGLTMFGIGAVLRVEDFQRISQRPVIVLIGSCAQFTIMPLGAFILAKAFNLPDELAAGLILAGCVPGAMASNVMSYIGRADTAYSVSLTTVSTLMSDNHSGAYEDPGRSGSSSKILGDVFRYNIYGDIAAGYRVSCEVDTERKN